MRWAGTTPVYRYERGGPGAPRPDPDTINQLAQVLEPGYADRTTLLGLAGHLPDTQPLTAPKETRLIAAVRPDLERIADPALVIDYRGRILAVSPALVAETGLPDRTAFEAADPPGGPTSLDLVRDPILGLADRLVDPDAVRRFQTLRFQLFNQLRRHAAWYRQLPDRIPLPRLPVAVGCGRARADRRWQLDRVAPGRALRGRRPVPRRYHPAWRRLPADGPVPSPCSNDIPTTIAVPLILR